MNESEKDVLFTRSVKAGRRIYYFDVKESRNGDKYISITESKKIVDSPDEHPHFEKHKLFLYKEDFDKFTNALDAVVSVASGKKKASDFIEYETEQYNNSSLSADLSQDEDSDSFGGSLPGEDESGLGGGSDDFNINF